MWIEVFLFGCVSQFLNLWILWMSGAFVFGTLLWFLQSAAWFGMSREYPWFGAFMTPRMRLGKIDGLLFLHMRDVSWTIVGYQIFFIYVSPISGILLGFWSLLRVQIISAIFLVFLGGMPLFVWNVLLPLAHSWRNRNKRVV